MPSSYVIEVPYRIVYSTFLFFASIEARFCLIAIEARISEAKTCRSENLRVLNSSTKKRVNEYIGRILSQRVNEKKQKYQENLQNYITNE
jgi:hypothetical protein